MRSDTESVGGCVIIAIFVCLVVAVVLGIVAAFDCLVAWLAVLVFGGFGVAIPFWPTVGAVVLLQLLFSLLTIRVMAR